MTMVMMGGAVALAVVVLIVAMLMKRRSGAATAEPTVQAEPARRRAVGASLIAEPVAQAAVDPRTVEEPRRKVDTGLTPWDNDAVSVDAPVDEADDQDDSLVAFPEADAPIEAPAPPQSPIIVEQDAHDEPSSDPFSPEDFGDEDMSSLVIPRNETPLPPLDEQMPSAPPPAEDGDPPSILSQLKTKKKAGASPLAGAAEGGLSSVPQGPSEIEETVSLVLRRQVPPRANEEPRSWLGGLPMMPEAVEWPRSVAPERLDEGEVPLHFVAQIACADFPEELWAGLGPRSGWLLLFLNPLDSQGDDPRLFRVLHIDALGPERQPPEDIRPVELEEAESDYLWCRSAGEAPTRWRRWPVDLVAAPNHAYDDGYRIVVTPPNYADELYQGAKVASGKPKADGEAPFSWRGALYVVDSVLRQLSQPFTGQSVGPGLREALDRPGFVASIIPELRARENDWLTEGDGAILSKEEPLRERERELRDQIRPIAEQRRNSLDRLAAFIVQNPTGSAIAQRVEADNQGEAEWRAGAIERLEAIRGQIAGQTLDAPLDPADWAALRDALAADRHARWTVEWTSRNSDFPVSIVEQDRSLLDLAAAGLDAATVELAADYQGDPALADLVPPALVAELEPHWRALTDNRPHRIGGFHDGLQSEPEDGPQAEVLLFQIASDEAMHWMWGDGGAYFVTISPRDLAAGRFDQAEIRLEQP